MFGLAMLLAVVINLVVTVWVLAKYSAVAKDYAMLQDDVNVMQGNMSALADIVKDVAADCAGPAMGTTTLPTTQPGQPVIDSDVLAQAQQVLASASPEDIQAAQQILGSFGLGDL